MLPYCFGDASPSFQRHLQFSSDEQHANMGPVGVEAGLGTG